MPTLREIAKYVDTAPPRLRQDSRLIGALARGDQLAALQAARRLLPERRRPALAGVSAFTPSDVAAVGVVIGWLAQ